MKSDLINYKYNKYSQWGEDGILEEILTRLEIKNYEDIWVVEFGAWDGKHLSNTFNLIEKGANSVLIEGDKNRFNDLLETKKMYEKIIPVNKFVEAKGVNSLNRILEETPIKTNYEILSIDIDSYQNLEIWENYKGNPTIVIIEINAAYLSFERGISKDVGNTFYDTNKVGEEKGYKLIAHTPNLIFIKKDKLEKIFKNISYKPSSLFNYHHFLKWRKITRREIIKLLFKNFSEVALIPMVIKLLPQKIKIKIIDKFY